MYGWVRRFMSYRSFYLWRARYYYYTRHLDGWMLASLLCLSGVVMLLWYYWRFTHVPPPRIHPQAAPLRGGASSDVDFNLAVKRPMLIDAIERSASTGRSVTVGA